MTDFQSYHLVEKQWQNLHDDVMLTLIFLVDVDETAGVLEAGGKILFLRALHVSGDFFFLVSWPFDVAEGFKI